MLIIQNKNRVSYLKSQGHNCVYLIDNLILELKIKSCICIIPPGIKENEIVVGNDQVKYKISLKDDMLKLSSYKRFLNITYLLVREYQRI